MPQTTCVPVHPVNTDPSVQSPLPVHCLQAQSVQSSTSQSIQAHVYVTIAQYIQSIQAQVYSHLCLTIVSRLKVYSHLCLSTHPVNTGSRVQSHLPVHVPVNTGSRVRHHCLSIVQSIQAQSVQSPFPLHCLPSTNSSQDSVKMYRCLCVSQHNSGKTSQK